MKSISKAGYGLYKFVGAVLNYCDVFKEVKPKIERVRFLEEELEFQIKTLNNLKIEIINLEKALADLNKKYETAIREKNALQEMLDQAERRLVSLELIISFRFIKNNFKIYRKLQIN